MLQGLSAQLNDLKRALAKKESQLREVQNKLKKLQSLLPNEENSLMMSSETDDEKISIIISNFYECCHIAKEHGCRLSISSRGEERDVSVIAINESSSLEEAGHAIENLIQSYKVQRTQNEEIIDSTNEEAFDNSETDGSTETECRMSSDSGFSNTETTGKDTPMPKPIVSRFIDNMPAVETSRGFEHFILFNVEFHANCLCSIFSFVQDRLVCVNLEKSRKPGVTRNIERSLRNLLKRESFLQRGNLWKTYKGTLHTFTFFMNGKVRYASVAISNKHIVAATVGKTEISSKMSMITLISTAVSYFVGDTKTIYRPDLSVNNISTENDNSSIGVHRRLLYCMFKNFLCLHEDLTPSTLFSTIALFALHVDFHFDHFKNF